MRLEICVRKDDMEMRGISCMLYVHKHRDTSPSDFDIIWYQSFPWVDFLPFHIRAFP